MQPMRETLAGRYELLDVVGRGGMGIVYRARDEILHRIVAVKVLQADGADDGSHVTRFEREAKAAGSLSDPHVVAVFDAGHEHGVHYMVMEFVEGQSLAQLIHDAGQLDPEHATRIAAQVAEALAAAHASGIIHRDIKPANVMIDAAGSVKVLDFGIARAANRPTLTQAAMVLGSAPYIAPEVIEGGRADERSDIYSLGCLLSELLTGRPPFTAELPAAVMHQHSTANPKAPSRLNPAVSPALDALVLSALAKSPQDRPQSAAEFKTRLESSAARAAAPATAATALLPSPPSHRHWRVPAAGVALLVIAGLLFTALGPSAGGTPARHHRVVTHAAKRRAHRPLSDASSTRSNTTSTSAVGTTTGYTTPTTQSPTGVPSAIAALSALLTQDLQSGAIDEHARPLLNQLQDLLNPPSHKDATHVAHAVSDIEQKLQSLAMHGDIQPAAMGPLTVALNKLQAATTAAGLAPGPPAPGPAHHHQDSGHGDDS